jgi:hypothetical protein
MLKLLLAYPSLPHRLLGHNSWQRRREALCIGEVTEKLKTRTARGEASINDGD